MTTESESPGRPRGRVQLGFRCRVRRVRLRDMRLPALHVTHNRLVKSSCLDAPTPPRRVPQSALVPVVSDNARTWLQIQPLELFRRQLDRNLAAEGSAVGANEVWCFMSIGRCRSVVMLLHQWPSRGNMGTRRFFADPGLIPVIVLVSGFFL